MATPSDNTFVTALPAGLTDEDVRRIFSAYGTVASVRVVSKPEHAFTSALVRYATVAEAQTIVETLNGNIPHTLATPIEVRYANQPGGKGSSGDNRSSPYPTGGGGGGRGDDNVFCTSLPAGLTEADIKRIFGAYGVVISCRIVSKPDMRFTSALIRFSSPEEAKTIVDSLNGNIPYTLTTPVECRFANKEGGKSSEKGGAGPGATVSGGFGGKGDGGFGDGGWGKGGTSINAEGLCLALEKSGVLPGHGFDRSKVVEVFVFGLPPDTRDEHLYRMFAPFGQVTPKGCAATFAKDTGLCKGFGFVNFLSPESAHMAIQTLHGMPLPTGHTLRVELKKPGKNAGPAPGGTAPSAPAGTAPSATASAAPSAGALQGVDMASMANALGVSR